MKKIILGADIADVLINKTEISAKIRRMARKISRDYHGETLLMISILKGGVFFLTDLSRHLTIPHAIDFFSITSYGAQSPSGEVRITKDLDQSVAGKHLLIVEDIVDTGLTLGYIIRNLERRNPKSIAVCTLLDRPYRRIIDIPIKYKGFDAPDKFLVGYGLDWKQEYRNLPYIGLLKPELLQK